MNCPNCGTANLDNATLCIQCGRPLSATSGSAVPPATPAESSSYTPPPPPPPSGGGYTAPSTGGYTPPSTSGYTPPPPTGGYTPSSPTGGYVPPGGQYGGGAGAGTHGPIPNYLIQSILVTLCCCLPLGIVAIVFAAQVNSKLASGDVQGALESSRKAKMFCWIAVGIGIVLMILSFAFNGAVFMEALRQNAGQ